MDVFSNLESNVRAYARAFPAVFSKAYGCFMEDEQGNQYLDFFSGAGALNYGHNHPALKKVLLDYIKENGICHSLDMSTNAKKGFIEKFYYKILKPRTMDYKLQFVSPTGTNAVEAAIKLSRKVTGRTNIVAFTNAFHGMSLGALAVTGSAMKRSGAAVPLGNSTFIPYEGYLGESVNTLDLLEKYLSDLSSGLDYPAAVIVETVQAEGGVNTASGEWLKQLARICKYHKILLIIDDIQVGCGRCGTFFSFESYGHSSRFDMPF